MSNTMTDKELSEFISSQVEHNETDYDALDTLSECLFSTMTRVSSGELNESVKRWKAFLTSHGCPDEKTIMRELMEHLIDGDLGDWKCVDQSHPSLNDSACVEIVPFQNHEVHLPKDFIPTQDQVDEHEIIGDDNDWFLNVCSDNVGAYFLKGGDVKKWLEDGENRPYAAYVDDHGIDISREEFNNAFLGEWDSERAYSEDYFNELYDGSIPDNIGYYIDHDKFCRDLFIGGSLCSIDTGKGRVWIFEV